MFEIGDKIYKKNFKNITEYNHRCLDIQNFVNNSKENLGINQTEEYIEIIKLKIDIKEEYDQEFIELKDYLNDTDYMVIKCSELGLIMSNEYPEDYIKRKAARARINELKQIMGG